jgi:hypothetical protein
MSVNRPTSDKKFEDIRLILKDFLKVIKIVSMYPENNPLPQSLRRTFAERFTDLVSTYGELDFLITATCFNLEQQDVFTDKSREESLAGLFFDCGVTRLTFKSGLDVDDIYRLLDTLKVYQGSDRRTRDLVAGLWEAGLKCISYETVEDVALRQYDGQIMIQEVRDHKTSHAHNALLGESPATYDSIFDESGDRFGDTSGRIEVSYLADDPEVTPQVGVLSTGNEELDGALQVSAAMDAMGLNDATVEPRHLDTRLILSDEHKLSEEEIQQVVELVRQDADFAEFESTCELVKEMLHQEAEMSDFFESVTIGERILTEFVKAGKLTYASELLRYFTELQEQLRHKRPLWAERLKDARTVAGSRERLTIFCKALNENHEIGNLEVRRYLDNFDWEALMAITESIGDLQHPHHREAVKDYLVFRGRDRIPFVAKGLTDRRADVVAASINILATIGTNDALQHLNKVVRHRDLEVRRLLVKTLAECPDEHCLDMLRELANDEEIEIQQAAVRLIQGHRGRPGFKALSDVLAGDKFDRLDPDDQRSVLIAYSRLGGDEAVDYLVELAEKMNLFRDRDAAFYREVAFEALAHNRGEKAERTLVKFSQSWRADLKAQARAALQRRRELIYGDDHE